MYIIIKFEIKIVDIRDVIVSKAADHGLLCAIVFLF